MKKVNLQKIVSVVRLLSCIGVIILGALYFFNIWSDAIYAYPPLMGISFACLAYNQWKSDRTIAWFSLVTAILICITCIAGLIMKTGG